MVIRSNSENKSHCRNSLLGVRVYNFEFLGVRVSGFEFKYVWVCRVYGVCGCAGRVGVRNGIFEG